MVLNLFIEGEEPEYIDDKEDVNGKFHYDATVHEIDAVFDSVKEKGCDKSHPFAPLLPMAGEQNPSRFASDQLEVSIGDVLDSVKGRMVLNLFIEGEEPEYLDDEPDEQQNGEELDPSKLKPMPEIAAEAEQSANEFIEDEAFLKSVIAGNEDFSGDDFSEKLIAAGEKHEDSPSEEMQNLVEQAAQVYSDWVVSESKKVL